MNTKNFEYQLNLSFKQIDSLLELLIEASEHQVFDSHLNSLMLSVTALFDEAYEHNKGAE